MTQAGTPRIALTLAILLASASAAPLAGCQSHSLLAAPAAEDERGLAIGDVPESARATLEREAAGARFEVCKTLVSEGRRLYVAQFKRADRDVEVRVFADGLLSSIDSQITIDELPANARAAALSHTVELDVTGCEKRVSSGGTTYVVHAAKGLRRMKVEVDASGKLIRKEYVTKTAA